MTTDTPSPLLARAWQVRIREQARYIAGLEQRLADARQQVQHLERQVALLTGRPAPEPVPYPVELAALHISLEATP